MSSFAGHAAAGAAVYLSQHRLDDRRALPWLPVLVLLALAPDADYLAIWFFGAQAAARVTHSLFFCLAVAGCAWAVSRLFVGRSPGPIPAGADTRRPAFAALAAAACSHLLLDFLVGVHPLPLLWPLVSSAWTSPWGLLPSAGRIDPGNFYFWRNLLIESALLWPVFALAVAWRRGTPWSSMRAKVWLVLPAWLAGLAWSVSLSR